MNHQTVIPSGSDVAPSFESFHDGGNQALVDLLKAVAGGRKASMVVYLWGGPATGKTHLLQATCGATAAQGRRYRYIDCDSAAAGPDDGGSGGEGPEGMLTCLDNLGPTRDGERQELAWLSMYERIRAGGGNLVVAAVRPPAELGLVTPDLVSRLSAGGVYRLAPLDDDAKRQVLAQRSRERGFEIPDNAIEYIMRHHARDTGALFRLLDRIDRASLSRHRRITVPFLRELLQEQPGTPATG